MKDRLRSHRHWESWRNPGLLPAPGAVLEQGAGGRRRLPACLPVFLEGRCPYLGRGGGGRGRQQGPWSQTHGQTVSSAMGWSPGIALRWDLTFLEMAPRPRPRARRVLPLHVSSSWLPSVSPDFSLLFLVRLLVLSWSPHPHAPLSLPLLSSSRSSSHLMSHSVSSCSSGPLSASALRRVRTGLPHLPRGPLTHWSPPPEYFSCRDVE